MSKSWEQQIFEYACWLCERDGHNPHQEFVEYDRSSYDYDEHIYYRWQDYELEAQRAVEYFKDKEKVQVKGSDLLALADLANNMQAKVRNNYAESPIINTTLGLIKTTTLESYSNELNEIVCNLLENLND